MVISMYVLDACKPRPRNDRIIQTCKSRGWKSMNDKKCILCNFLNHPLFSVDHKSSIWQSQMWKISRRHIHRLLNSFVRTQTHLFDISNLFRTNSKRCQTYTMTKNKLDLSNQPLYVHIDFIFQTLDCGKLFGEPPFY
mgnify:FL=1